MTTTINLDVGIDATVPVVEEEVVAHLPSWPLTPHVNALTEALRLAANEWSLTRPKGVGRR